MKLKHENATDDEKTYWWQVRKGPAKKRRWGWVDHNVNIKLEAAYQKGLTECFAVVEEWKPRRADADVAGRGGDEARHTAHDVGPQLPR